MNLATASTLMATLALLAGGIGLVTLGLLALPGGRAWLTELLAGQERGLLALAWLAVTTASLGSLYLSEVVGFVPCLLCWYQRIAMYPLVVILGVALLLGDTRVWRYVLPLAGMGLLISSYHVLIQFQPVVALVPCSEEIPCTVRYLSVFGFVSIPVMASMGFIFAGAFTVAARVTAGVEPLEE
ncbi:MAG: disulfide bond formation protein B [Gemmatimonadota bacterium]